MKVITSVLLAGIFAIGSANANAGQVLPNLPTPSKLDTVKLCSYLGNFSGTVMKYRQQDVPKAENWEALQTVLDEVFAADGPDIHNYFLVTTKKILDDAYRVPLIDLNLSADIQESFAQETTNLCAQDLRNGS